MKITECDIAIVGGGMVGAALASALGAQTSYSIVLVDALGAPDTSTLITDAGLADTGAQGHLIQANHFDSRVVALSRSSQRLLKKLSAWEAISKFRACPYYAMDVWDGEGTGRVKFDCRESHEPNLGYIVENSVVTAALHEKLTCHERITLMLHTQVCGAEPGLLTLKSSSGEMASLRCKLIIAADGARSNLREMMGIKTREWDYGHTAIVCTVKNRQPHGFACRQRFTQSGPVALLPLTSQAGKVTGDEYFSSLVWSTEDSESQALLSLNDEAFCNALSIATEHVLGGVVEASARQAFPLRQRHAVDYIQPGFALVGDAAHTIHPLAGQGVNLGFADVEVLVKEITRAASRAIPLEHISILQRYQRQRKTQNLLTMATMEGFKRLFASDDIGVRWLRNTGMNIFNRQNWLKKQLAKYAAGE